MGACLFALFSVRCSLDQQIRRMADDALVVLVCEVQVLEALEGFFWVIPFHLQRMPARDPTA